MRTLRIIALVAGIALGIVLVAVLAAGFWLNLAARPPSQPDASAAFQPRNAPPLARPEGAAARFQVRQVGDRPRIVDGLGRVVVLRGVTVGLPGDPAPHLPLGERPAEALSRLKSLGVNAIRVPVSWDSLQAAEGGIRVDRARQLIDLLDAARATELLVVLASHQDGLPGGPGLGGLPERALRGGPLDVAAPSGWDAYDTLRLLPHRMRWWADFRDGRWSFNDRTLQDNLIDTWTALGGLIRPHPALLGVSPIHDPECFPGAFGAIFDPGKAPCAEAIADFQDRFFRAYRTRDPDVLAFLEPPASGVPWMPGARTVDWTPPGIDGAVLAAVQAQDADALERPPARVLADLRQRADAANLPLAVVEAGPDRPATAADAPPFDPVAWVRALDAGTASGFLWLADPLSPPPGLARALNRPCPQRIGGIPVEWGFDGTTFALRFRHLDGAGDTRVRVPPAAFGDGMTWDDLEVFVTDGTVLFAPRDPDVLRWTVDPGRDEHVMRVRPRKAAAH